MRNKKQFKSVAIELDYSSCLTQAGMNLELQPVLNSGKSDRRVIINGKPIFFEIISQDSEAFRKQNIKYSNEIFDFIKSRFNSKETYIIFKKRNSDPKAKIDKLYDKLKSKTPPFDYRDDDLQILISDKKGGCRIEGSIINREENLITWVKRVLKKYRRLPSNIGGIIIANSSRLWDPQDIELVLNTSWRETKEGEKSRVAGIIFCVRQMLGVPSISGLSIKNVSSIAYINEFSKFNYTEELNAVAKAISKFPNWI